MSDLEDKVKYFRELDRARGVKTAADGPDSDDSLGEEEIALRRESRSFHSKSSNTAATPRAPSSQAQSSETPRPAPGRPGAPPRRVVFAPLSVAVKATPTSEHNRRHAARNPTPNTSFVAETPIPVPDSVVGARRDMLRRSETTPLPLKRSFSASRTDNSPSVALAAKKRKRAEQIKMVPETDRVLSGLRLFYIPNDDVAPARRARITKAREYGACWVRVISEATHVVVDRQLGYGDIKGVLGGLPAGGEAVVVGEDFPLDCIKFHHVLNPRQVKYRVSGWPTQTEDAMLSQKVGKEDLPLKAPPVNSKRWDYLPIPGTPSQGSVPSQKNAEDHEPPAEPSQGVISVSDSSQQSPVQDQPDVQTDKAEPEPDAFDDELSGYINMMQKYRALPLDEEHDDDLRSTGTPAASSSDCHPSSSDHHPSSDDEHHSSEDDRRAKPPKKKIPYEERFACHQGGTRGTPSTSPNARTIEVLQQMCTYYTRMDDQWRTISYRKAIKTLQRQPHHVRTASEARMLPCIGERLALKIEEIATTDRLQRLEHANAEPLDKVLQLFLGVYGAGLTQAGRWVARGFRTLEDLLQKADLTRNQRLGVERYKDLNTRIPRAEVSALGEVVKSAAAEIDPSVEVIIGGSYRRGAESSGDVDFVLTKEGTSSTAELAPFLAQLVQKLQDDGFLVATLAASSGADGSKWHGCCVLPGIPAPLWRRVDFLVVPGTELGAALLYFTGNDIFNRSMRLLASRKGMRLNQRGLYEGAMRGPGRRKVTEGRLVEAGCERRIFEVLGVAWREPWERWC